MAILSKLLFNGAGEVGQEFLAQQITVTKTHGSLVKMLIYGLLVKTPLSQAYDYIYKQLFFIYPNMPAVLKMFIANLFSSPLGSIAYYFAMGLTLKHKSFFEKYKRYFIYSSLLIPPILRFVTEKTVPYKFRQKFLYIIFLVYHFFINLHFKRIEGNKIFKKNNNNGETQTNMEITNKREIINGMSTYWNKDTDISSLFEWIITSINSIKNKSFLDNNSANSSNSSLGLIENSLDSDSNLSLKSFNKSVFDILHNKKNDKKVLESSLSCNNYKLHNPNINVTTNKILTSFDNNGLNNKNNNNTSSIQMKCCKKLSIKDVNVENKRVLIRVDYNIPIDIQGSILDNSLIIASLPTIQYCIKNKAKSIILISHLDEPGGQPQKDLSLGPIANELNRLLGKTVQFIPNCVGYDVERICNVAKNGDIILLENLKFHPEEDILLRKKANPKTRITENFRKYINSLSNLADIFVNDTYSLSHNEYTSLVALTVPVKVSGLLLKRELDVISLTLDNPKGPFVAIIGGLDIKENCELIFNLLEKVNILIIIGNLAYVFKHVLNNIKIGSSEFDVSLVNFVNNVIEKARKYKVELFFPIDYIIANKLSKDCKVGITNDNHGIPDGWIGVDIGPKSNVIFNKIILSAKTIFWIGVAGYHEIDKFSKGTKHLIESIAESTLQGAISIAAGKDTVKAIAKYKAQNKICHISTGNSKTFEFLDCNMLPAVTTLSNKI